MLIYAKTKKSSRNQNFGFFDEFIEFPLYERFSPRPASGRIDDLGVKVRELLLDIHSEHCYESVVLAG
jgi:hypothetical protein